MSLLLSSSLKFFVVDYSTVAAFCLYLLQTWHLFFKSNFVKVFKTAYPGFKKFFQAFRVNDNPSCRMKNQNIIFIAIPLICSELLVCVFIDKLYICHIKSVVFKIRRSNSKPDINCLFKKILIPCLQRVRGLSEESFLIRQTSAKVLCIHYVNFESNNSNL